MNKKTTRKKPPRFLEFCESNKDDFKECGLCLISHLMKEFNKDQTRLRTLVNEILHSIFFLGIVHKDLITPEDILSKELVEIIRQQFPKPFEKFRSHLPRRTPFSGLLEIMELKYDSKEKVMEGLCSLMKELDFPQPLKKSGRKQQHYYTMESTVICVSFNDSLSSKKYFGASVGCQDAKNIMIFSSCINYWHEYVSHAVMSFNQQKTMGDSLKFPASVKCQAYNRNWKTNMYEEKSPCLKCQQIFSLPGSQVIEQKPYPYGNCAETECLSKLLFNDQMVLDKTLIRNHTDKMVSDLTENTRKCLREMLTSISFENKMMNNEDLPLFKP